MMKIATPLVAALLLLLLAASCGGSTGDSPKTQGAAKPDGAGLVQVVAREGRFVPDQIAIPDGELVRLRFTNEDGQEHDLQVVGIDVEVREGGAAGAEHGAGAGNSPHGGQANGQMGPIAVHTTAYGSDEISFVARGKGTYEVWCTLTGHKDAGMVGRLLVE